MLGSIGSLKTSDKILRREPQKSGYGRHTLSVKYNDSPYDVAPLIYKLIYHVQIAVCISLNDILSVEYLSYTGVYPTSLLISYLQCVKKQLRGLYLTCFEQQTAVPQLPSNLSLFVRSFDLPFCVCLNIFGNFTVHVLQNISKTDSRIRKQSKAESQFLLFQAWW